MSKSTKTNLLQDNSWIRKANKSEDTVEQDPNFGRSVLKGYTSESLASPEGDELNTTKTKTTSTSVQALSKRYGGSPDDLKSSSSLSSSKTTTSSTKYTYSTVKSDSPLSTTKTIITEKPQSSTTTTTITKNGTTETTVTTTESVSSPVAKSPTETFSQRVKSSSKDPQYSTYSPTRTTKVTETTVTSTKDAENKPYDAFNLPDDLLPSDSKTSISTTETVTVKSSNDAHVEDKLYDTLLPKSFKDDVPSSKTTISSTKTVTVKSSSETDVEDKLYDTLLPKSFKDDVPSSKTGTSSTETVTVRSSPSGDGVKTTTTIRTSSRSDDFNDTYLPRVTTSSVSSSYSSDKSYSYTRPDSSYDYTSITSPTSYSSLLYRSSSRSDDILSDPIYSRSSVKTVYASPERTVLEKDLCTSCRKPFTGDAKIVLSEMSINCHATCFKCEECNYNLGHLKAGDSMWVYRRRVHCENCFEATRAKWRR